MRYGRRPIRNDLILFKSGLIFFFNLRSDEISRNIFFGLIRCG
jgi:hypothetical protein